MNIDDELDKAFAGFRNKIKAIVLKAADKEKKMVVDKLNNFLKQTDAPNGSNVKVVKKLNKTIPYTPKDSTKVVPERYCSNEKCNNPINTTNPKAIFCSRECKSRQTARAYKKRKKDEKLSNRPMSEFLGTKKVESEKKFTCEYCGNPSDSKYCNEYCEKGDKHFNSVTPVKRYSDILREKGMKIKKDPTFTPEDRRYEKSGEL